MTFNEWLEIGQKNGWVGETFCYAHNEPPTTQVEDEEWAEDLEPPCFSVARIFPND